MNIQAQHVEALARFGYTERESRFLYLVATHSGFFLQRQLAQYFSISGRGPLTDFLGKARENEHTHEYPYEQGTQKLYHLFSRSIYGALGKEHSGNRHPGKGDGFPKAFGKLL